MKKKYIYARRLQHKVTNNTNVYKYFVASFHISFHRHQLTARTSLTGVVLHIFIRMNEFYIFFFHFISFCRFVIRSCEIFSTLYKSKNVLFRLQTMRSSSRCWNECNAAPSQLTSSPARQLHHLSSRMRSKENAKEIENEWNSFAHLHIAQCERITDDWRHRPKILFVPRFSRRNEHAMISSFSEDRRLHIYKIVNGFCLNCSIFLLLSSSRDKLL